MINKKVIMKIEIQRILINQALLNAKPIKQRGFTSNYEQ
jgi:hypothetical protein